MSAVAVPLPEAFTELAAQRTVLLSQFEDLRERVDERPDPTLVRHLEVAEKALAGAERLLDRASGMADGSGLHVEYRDAERVLRQISDADAGPVCEST